MKKKAHVVFLAMSVFVFLATGCVQEQETTTSQKITNSSIEKDEDIQEVNTLEPKSNNISLGVLNEGKYTNPYFGLIVSIPDEWVDITMEEKLEKSGVTNEESLTDADEVYGFEVSSSSELADVIFAFSEVNISQNITAEDYANYLKDIYAELYGECSEIETIEINGIPYSYFSLKDNTEGSILCSDVYCVIRNGYALEFTSEYYEDEIDDIKDVENLINSISFTP